MPYNHLLLCLLFFLVMLFAAVIFLIFFYHRKLEHTHLKEMNILRLQLNALNRTHRLQKSQLKIWEESFAGTKRAAARIAADLQNWIFDCLQLMEEQKLVSRK